MKKRLLAYIILSFMLSGCFTGCGADDYANDNSSVETDYTSVSTEESAPVETVFSELLTESDTDVSETAAEEAEETVTEIKDYNEFYRPVLDKFYDYICNHGDVDIPEDGGMTGVFEVVNGLSENSALELIGYTITDISGDDIPELAIGYIDERSDSSSGSSIILAVYNCAGGEPALTFEGWSRSSNMYKGNGRIFYSGSSGAMYSSFGEAAVSKDGSVLEWSDFYFTDCKNGNEEEIALYHNNDGIYDTEASEELTDMTFDEFFAIQESMGLGKQSLEMTPFSKYNTEEEVPAVLAEWAENYLYRFEDYDEFIDDDSAKVIFYTYSKVKNFKVLSLEFEDADDDGTILFKTEELYSQNELSKDRAFVLGMKFAGTIPQYGISYTDQNGNTRRYSVSISGRDGSVVLSEF